jgi:small neutral amino acid transporter SnatA (MarC family)
MMKLTGLFEQVFVPYFLGGLVSLITITNPVPKIPLFMTLAADMDKAQRNEQARKACVYAFVILAVSLFAGVLILEGFGISQGALRIAGGLTVAILGYRMVMWATLRSAQIVSRYLGEQGMEALSRLMGFLLVCIGVQFIGSGVRTFMAGT